MNKYFWPYKKHTVCRKIKIEIEKMIIYTISSNNLINHQGIVIVYDIQSEISSLCFGSSKGEETKPGDHESYLCS